MLTATIKVSFINQVKPGKKKGSIKTADDVLYGCWPDKLALFTPGSTYEITYDEQTFNGAIYKDIKSAKLIQAAPAVGGGNGAATSGGYGTYRETSATDAQRMFVTAIVKAAVQAGTVTLSAESLTHAVQEARLAWDQTFGAATVTKPPKRDDMNDDISY